MAAIIVDPKRVWGFRGAIDPNHSRSSVFLIKRQQRQQLERIELLGFDFDRVP